MHAVNVLPNPQVHEQSWILEAHLAADVIPAQGKDDEVCHAFWVIVPYRRIHTRKQLLR